MKPEAVARPKQTTQVKGCPRLPVSWPITSKAGTGKDSSINVGGLINYGERFQAGKRIPSAMAESSVSAAASMHFTKRQQMQWAQCVAHLLPRARSRAFNGS